VTHGPGYGHSASPAPPHGEMTRFLVLVFLANCIQNMLASCPLTCVCIWKNGKETVECINRDLGDIPDGVEPSTQVLDLRGNSIPVLPDNLFSDFGITNLQKIFIQYCKIRAIEAAAFNKLTNLVELDLGENLIQEVPSEALKQTKALMRLNLSGNPIKHIRSHSFKLPFLLTLELSHCRIEIIMDDAFSGLESLEWLKLEDNSLTTLAGDGLFPKTLKGVEIHNNPWNCDCQLQEFTHWVHLTAIPRVAEPRCDQPFRLQNRTVQSLAGSELACPPSVTPVVMQLQSEEGRNISLKCKVTGIPEAAITWGHQDRSLTNGTIILNIWDTDFFQVTEFYSDSNTKVSELFILNIRQEDTGNYFCSGKNAAGSARANFTITVFKRKEAEKKENITQESKQMFKVEYILGFGAAVVIVLTIIIVLILYLILQCKQKRRERQLRKLICDSRSSDSFAERSTVDYIVPGEMELMSAVRSVSCNSSMSKCNKTDDETDEYGPNGDGGPPLIDSLFVKQQSGGQNQGGECPPPPPPPNGTLSCSNPDLVQDTKLWDRGVGGHKPGPGLEAGPGGYRGLNGAIPTGGPSYAPHQYFPPPRMMYPAPHNYNPRLQFTGHPGYRAPMAPMTGYLGQGPPQYRHPPPVQIHTPSRDMEDDNINETVLSAANLSGSPMPHFYGPDSSSMMWSTAQPGMSFTNPQMSYSSTAAMSQMSGYHQNPYLGFPRSSQPFEHTKDCPRSRTLGGFHSNMNSRTQQQQSLYFNRGQFQQQPHPMLSRPGQLQYPPGGDYHNQFAGGYGPPPYCPPPVPQWSREEEEMKYGPFSDGEAETMRRSGTRSCKKMSRGRGGPTAPHYATMSRVQDLSSRQQSSFDSNDGQGSHSIKYTSQPQLNGSLGDYLGNNHRQYGGQDALTPLSIKTSITFPRQPATAGSIKPLTRQDNVRSSYDSTSQSNYPDLARHPLSYSVAPPPKPYPRPTPHVQFPSHMMTRSMVSNRQNSSDDGHFDYEHSRSSSLGDLWGFNGVQDMRMATPDGFKSLPYDSNVKLAINGVKKRTARSGAVKIDLTCADKSIRRPGSAPDLVGGEELASCHNSPGANSLRDKKNGSFKDRARSTSSESRENCAPKKVGISPGTRKVAFAGIEDDDSESESDKQSRLDSITSVEEDVWIKQPHRPPSSKRPPDPDTIPTTGVVIAKAAPPPPPPHQQTFQSSKLQQAQQQNKCNGIR